MRWRTGDRRTRVVGCQKEERKAARERFVERTGADPSLRDWDGRLEEAELRGAVNELAEEVVVDDEQWPQRRNVGVDPPLIFGVCWDGWVPLGVVGGRPWSSMAALIRVVVIVQEPYVINNGIWINARRAPGIDGITADIAGRAYDAEPELFEALFNKCLELGAFPRCWKKQLVRVIPKAGKSDASDARSYRPISLLPVIGKALDSFLINRIEYHVFANGHMSDNQYGFRRGRSTVDAIERVVRFIRNAKNSAEYSAAILLDISSTTRGGHRSRTS
ncbi:hypothetical protein Trydic_g4851 [Trypoxylus dichotomus]